MLDLLGHGCPLQAIATAFWPPLGLRRWAGQLRGASEGWELLHAVEGRPHTAMVIDQADAWLLCTKRMDRATARARIPSIRVEEDTGLGETALEMVFIMA